MGTEKNPLVTKGTAKVCLVLYSMGEGEQFQAISVPPKEAKRIVNQFKETGKMSYFDPSKVRACDVKLDEPTPSNVHLEPHSVVVSYVSDFYTKQH